MKNWGRKKIKEVIPDLHQGLNTAGYKIKFYDEGYPIIQTRNLENGVIDLDEKMKFMSKDDWETYKDKYKPKVGDVFLTNIGTIGKTAVVTEEKDYLIHWNIFIFKLDRSILDPFYLKSFLDTPFCFDYYKSFQKGGTVNFITKKMIENLEIPLPSLPEQQRIVSILDEAFAAIAKAKANAEQNLKNAKELFESYLQGMFENGNWETKKLSEVAKHSLGKMLDKNKNKGEPKEYLRNQNVRWFEFDLSDLNEMPFLENEKEKYTAIKGDVMICEGGYPGRAAIWEEDYPIYFQKAIHRVRFHDEEYNKWFLFYLFILDKTGKLKNHFTGTGIQHFTGDALGKLILPFPPLDKVKTIVRQLDALRAETQKLEAVYQQKIADLEELKKSILQKAFAGELRSPEGAEYKSEVATPLADKKPNTITSPEGV